MIKVTDYIVKRLEEYGITDVFMVTGGGAMHLNDSFGKSEKIRCICNHHEQASAIAAEGYARQKQSLAVVNVTTGPGGLNTLNGVFGQWTDSVPVLYVSGQVRLDTTVLACPDLNLRQMGDQEVRIVDVVKPLTKYAVIITDAKDIRKELEKAIYLATNGRPGPVWVDVPMNIQGSSVDEDTLEGFVPPAESADTEKALDAQVDEAFELLNKAERPVIVAGHGIRLSGTIDVFKDIIDQLGIPVVSTLNGFDVIENEHPLSIGTIGSIGSRGGNFAIQNADFVLFLGTRNNIRQISYNWPSFARAAVKVAVDIDDAELKKPFLKYDLSICADLKDFLPMLKEKSASYQHDNSWWLNWCQERKGKYDSVLDSYKGLEEKVNPYNFMRALSEALPDNSTVVTGDATACICYFQAGKVRNGQRVIWNSGCASMGYDLPASIGACVAGGNVVCLAGDGSLQMNIQELMTMVHLQLPIKLFYLNNDGYISMKQTQDNFFGRRIGADTTSGVGFPQIERIAGAYGINFARIDNDKNLADQISDVLKTEGPVVCEVILPAQYFFAPKLSSERKPDGRLVTKPMEDMFPFLEREEFMQNMIIQIAAE